MEIGKRVLVICMNAERKRKTSHLFKLNKQLIRTIQILESDLRFAVKQWQQSKATQDGWEQFWRRTVIRCFCATVEATLSMLKGVTCDTADFFGVLLEEKDIEVATEKRVKKENGVSKIIPAFLRPIDRNVKETLKVFLKAHGLKMEVKYDGSGLEDLHNTFELRHKLMHPKAWVDLQISDTAIDMGDRGNKWFNSVLAAVLTECMKKSPFPKSTSPFEI